MVSGKVDMIQKGKEYIEKLEKLKIGFFNVNDMGVIICDTHINRLHKELSKLDILSEAMLENEKEGFLHKLNVTEEYLKLNDGLF